MTVSSSTDWDTKDLVRRVVDALDLARRTIRAYVEGNVPDAGVVDPAFGPDSRLLPKVVAETAMLLLAAAPLRILDERIRVYVEEIARRLVPLSRGHEALAGICLDPGRAREHAVAHLLLSRLGIVDLRVDALLASIEATDGAYGPERMPHRRLELEWLKRVWPVGDPPTRAASRLLSDSALGRPLDALGSTRLDIYAFTHAVMYASDLGARRFTMRRRPSEIAADAESALAHGLDHMDFDLSAEVLATWPMLRLPWSAGATFAFRLLADASDELGFLPGPRFDRSVYVALPEPTRSRYAISTSYHTAYVMAFLCAAALAPGRAPPASVPSARRLRGTAAAVLTLMDAQGTTAWWRRTFAGLSPRQQDGLAPLLLAMVLRRARAMGDLTRVRAALELALRHGRELCGGPAVRQAATLLARGKHLERCLAEGAARMESSVSADPCRRQRRHLPGPQVAVASAEPREEDRNGYPTSTTSYRKPAARRLHQRGRNSDESNVENPRDARL